jgi:hypothetical protein
LKSKIKEKGEVGEEEFNKIFNKGENFNKGGKSSFSKGGKGKILNEVRNDQRKIQ